MIIEEIDFYELCLDEGGVFYQDVYTLDKEDFNEWVRANLTEVVTIDNYDVVAPDNNLVEEMHKRNYGHIYYQCHYSAKAVTILSDNIEYYTGFVERGSYPYPIITHSFNVLDGTVVDFARLSSVDDPLEGGEDSFPHTYYGIQIPREFVLRYIQETLEEKSMRPLLVEWYLENM